MSQTVNIYDQARLERVAEDVDILTDAERLERSMGNLISTDNVFHKSPIIERVSYRMYFPFAAECGECSIYYPNVTKDFEKISLEVNHRLQRCLYSVQPFSHVKYIFTSRDNLFTVPRVLRMDVHRVQRSFNTGKSK